MRYNKTLAEKFDTLNDLAEGVLVVPAPRHLDREERDRKTADALDRILKDLKQ